MAREEARERFKRIAATRANRVIKDLHILMNCSDRKNYEYDAAQVHKIFSAIENELTTVKSKFVPRTLNTSLVEL